LPHLGKDNRHESGGDDNVHEVGLCVADRGGAVTDPILRSDWETQSALDLTPEQMAFLADLRKGAFRAIAAQDASVSGPLIRANLVRWTTTRAKRPVVANRQAAHLLLPAW
jgi:hypothetical protein